LRGWDHEKEKRKGYIEEKGNGKKKLEQKKQKRESKREMVLVKNCRLIWGEGGGFRGRFQIRSAKNIKLGQGQAKEGFCGRAGKTRLTSLKTDWAKRGGLWEGVSLGGVEGIVGGGSIKIR